MQLFTMGPASGAARAQLLFALLILALLPAVLISMPPRTHGLRFDMEMIAEQLAPGESADRAGWIQPYRRSRSRPYFFSPYRPGPRGPRHSLELLPTGQLLFEARAIGRDSLGVRLVRTDGWVDFRPHPDARYEDVVETLLIVARSGSNGIRLDNSRYSEAFEAAAAD